MRKFMILALAMCTLSITVNAQKKEKKEKKPKTEKTYEWNWDGTKSGNQQVDDYLVTIDTLWNKIQSYHEEMESYEFHQDTLTINGKYYIAAYMTTGDGSLVTRATCNWQLVSSIANGVSIASEAAKAGMMGASAATALPSLGLMKAATYAKYLKGAPNIISMATKEIKTVVGIQKSNAKSWKSLKNGALDEEGLKKLNYYDEKAIDNMKRCVYIKEIPDNDPSYQVVHERQQQKSPDQIQAEIAQNVEKFQQAVILPEEKSKQLDDISDDELNRELNG